MKNTYIALDTEIKGRCYSYILKVSTSDNLISKLESVKRAGIC